MDDATGVRGGLLPELLVQAAHPRQVMHLVSDRLIIIVSLNSLNKIIIKVKVDAFRMIKNVKRKKKMKSKFNN